MEQMKPDPVAQALDQFEMLTRHRQSGNLNNTLTLDAVCWRLAFGVDALAQLTDQHRNAMMGAEWRELWSIRNRTGTDYRSVNTSTIEPFLDNHLSSLMETLRHELAL